MKTANYNFQRCGVSCYWIHPQDTYQPFSTCLDHGPHLSLLLRLTLVLPLVLPLALVALVLLLHLAQALILSLALALQTTLTTNQQPERHHRGLVLKP